MSGCYRVIDLQGRVRAEFSSFELAEEWVTERVVAAMELDPWMTTFLEIEYAAPPESPPYPPGIPCS